VPSNPIRTISAKSMAVAQKARARLTIHASVESEPELVRLPSVEISPETGRLHLASAKTQSTNHEDSPAANAEEVPAGKETAENRPELLLLPAPVGEPALTLEDLHQMAASRNPALAQAAGRVKALRGKWVQVGLHPNPILGYASDEMGDEGTAGFQGGYVSQQFITGRKLKLNRSVVRQEIAQAEAEYAAVAQRVRTDVQMAFYRVLLAQRRVALTSELVGIAEKAVLATKQLFEAEEVARVAILQAQVEANAAEVMLQHAKNDQRAAWRRLTAVVAAPEIELQEVRGEVDQLPPDYQFEQVMQRLLALSPEIAAASAATERARWALSRAKAEPIPNINAQVTVQHNNENGDEVAAVQLGVPLPILDRNQGRVQQAVSEIFVAEQNLSRLELRLLSQLADVYQAYADARVQVVNYSEEVLPQAQETLDLINRGYLEGEVDFIALLTAQRTYSQTNLAYLDALRQLWTRAAQIEGLLLEGSLDVAQ